MLIGHFCYGRKFGIITNGLGIPRHIDFFDEDFKTRHKDFIYEDTDSPDFDKSVSDSKSLMPIFTDFYNLHPSFHHDIFLGDAAFDTVAIYDFLLRKNDNGISLFTKAFIPLNSRASSDKPDFPLNEHGIPVCPFNHSLPMVFNSHCHERGRADRDKWICPAEKLEIAKLLNLMFFSLVLLNFLLLLLLIVCLNLNTSEVLKNLLVNIWFSMF